MHNVVKEMLAKYSCATVEDHENALKEIIQQIALLGMWRAKFFEHGAFYGGTALRILHGLDRFSEDMDFSLLQPNRAFDIGAYESALTRELTSFGFDVHVEKKVKRLETPIESAFIKANTLVHLLKIRPDLRTHRDRLLQIKIEVDTNPPGREESEVLTTFKPIPFSVRSFTRPVLLAGKLTAALFRTRNVNIKGRDWYDFLWYISRDTPCHLGHLTSRLSQIGQWPADQTMTIEQVQQMLLAKIDSIDIERAKTDVRPFVTDPAIVDQWTREMFRDAARRLRGV